MKYFADFKRLLISRTLHFSNSFLNKMKKYIVLQFIFLLFVTVGLLVYSSRVLSIKKNTRIHLKQIIVNNAHTIDTIRLVESFTSSPVIFFSRSAVFNKFSYITNIEKLDFNDSGPAESIFRYEQIVPVRAQWDVICNHYGSYQCIIQIAGGALNRLFFLDKNGERKPLTNDYFFKSFSDPRFLKSAIPKKNPGISTIVDSDSLILFTKRFAPQILRYQEVGNWSNNILLQSKTGYFLFSKKKSIVHDNMGNLQSSIQLIEFDDLLQVKGQPYILNIGQDINEFDVDIMDFKRKETFTLLVTGKDNVTLYFIDNQGKINDRIFVAYQYPEKFLERPAVSVKNARIYIAVIENVGQSNARILKAQIH